MDVINNEMKALILNFSTIRSNTATAEIIKKTINGVVIGTGLRFQP